jgi:hypothetical protein
MKGFISYAHADHKAYEAFCKALVPAACGLGTEFWSDPLLHTGQDWNQAIADAVTAAEVFVALVSVESLYSSYIRKQEPPAMQARSNATGALILPVVVNRCLWEYQFAAIQVAPTLHGRPIPIADWKPQHNGFDAASRQAANAIKRHYNLPAGATP